MNVEESASRPVDVNIKVEDDIEVPLPLTSCSNKLDISSSRNKMQNEEEQTEVKFEISDETKPLICHNEAIFAFSTSISSHENIPESWSKIGPLVGGMDSVGNDEVTMLAACKVPHTSNGKEQVTDLKNGGNVSTDNNERTAYTSEQMLAENTNIYQSGMHARSGNQYSDQLEMPPLCSTAIATPTLSIQFSPLLNFSEERVSGSNEFARQLVEVASGECEVVNEACKEEKSECGPKQNGSSSSCGEDFGSYMALSSWTPLNEKVNMNANDFNPNNDLTYADNLLLNASQGRQLVIRSPPIEWQSIHSPKVTGKKRKSPNPCRSNRQPQKRFSTGLDRNEVPGGDLFVSKSDGRVRLTTNLPRAVEALDPDTFTRVHLYASCSEAAREMKINRTRMSRTCRGGGGQIGDFFYQYTEMSGQDS